MSSPNLYDLELFEDAGINTRIQNGVLRIQHPNGRYYRINTVIAQNFINREFYPNAFRLPAEPVRQALPFLNELQQAQAQRINRARQAVLGMNYIENQNWQGVFDLLLDGYTFSQEQSQRIANEITREAIRNRLVVTINGQEQYIVLNLRSREFLETILQQGFLVDNVNDFNSDSLAQMNIQDITDIVFERVPIPPRVIQNKDGNYFPYINTTDINLSKYQIYNQEQAEKANQEQCLIHALKQCGISPEDINRVKLSIKTGASIAKKLLKHIAEDIKRKIVLHTYIGIKHKKTNIGKGEPIHIALYENHYFLYESTKYSKFSIKNYEDIKNEKAWRSIAKKQIKKDGTYRYIHNNKSKIDSLSLVRTLHKNSYFKVLNMSMFNQKENNPITRDTYYLSNITEEQQLVECKSKEPKIQKIWYADCEAFVYREKQPKHGKTKTTTRPHELYLLGFVSQTDDYVHIMSTVETSANYVVNEFLDKITNCGRDNALVYFHNMKYDYHLLAPYLDIKDICQKDGQMYNVVIKHGKVEVELRDSYKIIPFKLSKFQKEFDLPAEYGKMEAIAYEYYTHRNHDQRIKASEYEKCLSNKDKEIFKKNITTEYFNPTRYYMEYLKLDCLVLKKGVKKFNELIKDITNMSVYDSLTISSLTDKYMKQEGAYGDVYEMSGNLRDYVSKAVYGGRVCVNEKYKKKVVEGKISDYDGVSLYPSAINRLCREIGLPTGKAIKFDGANWEDKVYSILTVKIIKVNKHQQMPFIAHKTSDSIQYLNEPPKEPVVIDSITLQDYINFHEIEYVITEGVYWEGKVNRKMGTIIQTLFNARLKAKKQKKKALSNVIKLMLNSSYGKTIMKKSNTQKKIVKNKRYTKNDADEWITKEYFDSYVYNNFNTIKNYRKITDKYGGLYQVEKLCVDKSFNRGHIGCAILSMSKRIMNEVFDVANTNKYPIYYTDTDSLHCNLEDVPKLEANYKERYNKELNGKALEQFHTDFSMLDEDENPRQGKGEEIYAIKSIFLGKKSYMDYLESKGKDGNIIHGFHIRLKGITEAGLEYASKDEKYRTDELPKNYIGLYEDLAKGKEIEIDLMPHDKETNKKNVLFEYEDGKVSTRSKFTRKVKF